MGFYRHHVGRPVGHPVGIALGPHQYDIADPYNVLSRFVHLDHTCGSPRYAMAGNRLLGPFAANVLAKARVDGRWLGGFEEARTNELLHNCAIDNAAFGKNQIVTPITPNTIIAPDGTVDAEIAIADTSPTGYHTVYQDHTADGSSIYAISGFAYPSVFINGLRLQLNAGGFSGLPRLFYDFRDGSISSVAGSPLSYGLIPLVNNWWYWYMTALSNGAVSAPIQMHLGHDGTWSNFAGDGSSGLGLWGMQMEKGAFPSSLIKTEGTTETRLKTEAFFPAAKVPAVMRDGKWALDIIPHASHDSWDALAYMIDIYDSASGKYVYVRWGSSGSPAYQVRNDGGLLVASNNLTFSAYQKHTIILDAVEGSIEIVGATTGDGKVIGTPWTGHVPATAPMWYGTRHQLSNEANSKLTEPYKKAA